MQHPAHGVPEAAASTLTMTRKDEDQFQPSCKDLAIRYNSLETFSVRTKIAKREPSSEEMQG